MSRAWWQDEQHPAWNIDRDGNRRYRVAFDPDFIPGLTYPDDENTGCRVPESELTVVDTPFVADADDMVLERMYFKQGIIRRANRVVIRDCIVNESDTMAPGTASTKNPAGNLVAIDFNQPNFMDGHVEFTTLVPRNPSVRCYGILGTNYSTHRVRIKPGFVDCMNLQTDINNKNPGSCFSSGDYVSPTVYDSDPSQSGGKSHSDGFQIANGRGHKIIGSRVECPVGDEFGHGVVIGPYAPGAIGGVEINYCWFSGGGVGISAWANGSTDKAPYVPGMKVRGNRFDTRGMKNETSGGIAYPYAILMNPQTHAGAIVEGNVQTHPCTPASGTPYGASATPEKPVTAHTHIAALNW